jgi:hypothetical protein
MNEQSNLAKHIHCLKTDADQPACMEPTCW